MVAGALQGDQKALLTLVEILRRTGGFEPVAVDSLLPDNYENILEAYVQSQVRSGPKNSGPSTKKGDKP